MRVLAVAMTPLDDWAARLRAVGLDIVTVQPDLVDLGEFGGWQRQAPAPGRVVLPVRPRQPYVYGCFAPGRLAATIRRVRPDLLYLLNEPSDLSAAQTVLTARAVQPGLPVVVYCLENVERDWLGLPRLLRGVSERAVLGRVDHAVACSAGAGRVAVARGLPPGRLTVIPPGCDGVRFTPAGPLGPRAEWLGTGRLLVGYLGRLVPEKGVDLLLRALAQLPEQVVLAVAGDGYQAADLRGLTGALGLGERVRWLGRVAAVPEFLRAVDVLVLPSRRRPDWEEQFGRALAEAMLCGTPVVGSDTGAIPEVIGPGGLVCRADDPADLAHQLRRLHERPAWRTHLAHQALAWARRQYDWSTVAPRLAGLFRQVAGMTRGG